jgi:tetratricopeptide (TPR) repeat protein
MRLSKAIAIGFALAALAGCATRTAPPLPAALAYPEFMYPVAPAGTVAPDDSAAVDRGWRFLQNGDLRNAEREFTAVARRSPALAAAGTGNAYVALARDDFERAVRTFNAALTTAPMYVPALVGRGQALLELKRDDEALKSFEAALAVDPSLPDLRQRVAVLRFRGLQALIESARTAAAAERLDEAAAAYERAIAASPESAFLHRELAAIERKRRNDDAALVHLRRATEIDPADAAAFAQIGELLEARQDFTGAEAAYRRALEVDPSPALTARIAALSDRAREARMPPEFRAIASAAQLTRGDLAALLGVRLEDIVRIAPPREAVITDLGGHWAAAWITQVARAGLIEPFANHTFQPDAVITRADLAAAVSRAMALLAADRPALRGFLTDRPRITDMAPGHLSYPAAAVAVASGIMALREGGRFESARPVTGAEATDVIARLRSLANAR